MELGVPAYLINATVLGVLAQRLVRTLCRQCRQPDEAPRARRWRKWCGPGSSPAAGGPTGRSAASIAA